MDAFNFASAALVIAGAIDAAAADLPDVLRHVDPSSHAVVVVPNAKAASAELVTWLEGMGHDMLLGGERPVDLLKSTLRLSVAFDDDGSLALAAKLVEPESLRWTLFVPVTDADQFIAANFKPAESPDRVLWLTDQPYAIRSFGSHVAVSEHPIADHDVDAAQAGQLIDDQVAAAGNQLLARSDAFIWISREGLAALQGDAVRRAQRQLTEIEFKADRWVRDAEGMLIGVDLDPLTMIISSLTYFEPQSEMWNLTAGGEPSIKRLGGVPAKSFYWAMSVDFNGLGGAATWSALLESLGSTASIPSLDHAQGFDFAAYPSPAGLQGGLLNDAPVVVYAGQPRQALEEFKSALNALVNGDEPGAGKVIWNADHQLRSGEVVNAFEVTLPPGADAIGSGFVRTLLFGSVGWRGFARLAEDRLILTYSQRPSVLESAMRMIDQPGEAMSEDAVVRTMRSFMPPNPDVELYINLATLSSMFSQMGRQFGRADDPPMIDALAAADPIGIFVHVQDHAVRTTLVIPASLTSIAVDLGMQGFRERGAGESVEIEQQPRDLTP